MAGEAIPGWEGQTPPDLPYRLPTILTRQERPLQPKNLRICAHSLYEGYAG